MRHRYTLHLSEIIYDCELQVHEIGNKLRADGKPEGEALVEEIRSEARDGLLRSCGLACKHLYELLGHYAEPPESGYTNNALISDKKQDSSLLFSNHGEIQETAYGEEGREFEYVLVLPSNIRKSALASVGEIMHRYVVSHALYDWFGNIGLPDLQKEYEQRKAVSAATLQLTISKRSRPCSGDVPTYNSLKYE